MIAVPRHSRSAAESTLTATATFTRAGVDTFTAGEGITTATRTTIWTGPASIGPPSGVAGTTSRTGNDDRIGSTRIVRLPTTCPTCPCTSPDDDPDLIHVGDHLTLDDDPTTYVVKVVQRRTTEVLRRVQVISLADAQRVPR